MLDLSLWSLCWPIFFETLLSFTLGLEDSLYLARISGYAAGAVGAIVPILGLCGVSFQTLAHSGATIASQLIGGARHEQVNRALLAIPLVNGTVGALLAMAVFAGHRAIGRWLGLDPDSYRVATEYLRLLGPLLFLAALRTACAAIINARGQTRFNMISALLVNLLNLGLNHLLTMGSWGLPRLGVAGVAYATIIAESIGLLFSAWVVSGLLDVRGAAATNFTNLKGTLGQLLGVALPSVVEPLSWQLNQLALIRLVVTCGAVALSVRTYTLNLIGFAAVGSFALGLGTQLQVAHLVGAGRCDQASARLLRSVRLAMLGGVAMMALLGALAGPLYSLYTPDPEVARQGRVLVLLGLLLEPCRAINLIIGGSLRGLGDARYVTARSVLLTWGVAIPMAYVLSQWLHLGLIGVWIAMIGDELARALMNYRRWQSGEWQKKGVVGAG